MKLRTKRLIGWGILGLLALIVCYLVLLVSNPSGLEGRVSSYELFPHSKSDVLEFENGLVTLKTCCGNSWEGDYMLKDDVWVWEHQALFRRNPPELKFNEPVRIEVEPSFFSITLRFDDGQTLKLPRRVFTKIPL